jgi:8-oxo-dGTP pyrophosphatase MutT (NUDIX family)
VSVRSRIAAPVEVTKVFGPGVPESFVQGEQASQMTPASPFSPGTPIGPYDGYDRVPRSRDFVPGTNIATRPRAHERISFETLKGLVENYDVAKIAIRHRIASIRSMDYKLIAAEGYAGDVTDAIPLGKAALARPDRKTLFKPWLAKWVRDILSYDAGTLYRMRNRGGRCIGLKVVDGTMIAPMLDYWGDSPDPPAEAYVQYVNGLPWNWLTRNDIIYEPYDPQADSIYGKAPLEDILLNANTDIRFQLYFLQRFTEGNIPEAFASAPESWGPEQIETFQEYWDAFMLGDQSRKNQIRWIPGGSSFAWSNEKEFTDTFSLFLMRKTCAAFSVVPTDLGFTENANLASGESQADVQHRVGDLPLAHHIQDILSSFLQDDLGLPLQFAFDLGEEQDDRLNQANADQVYIQNGVIGASEIREMRFGLPEPEGQQVPRFIFTTRSGPVPLSALLAVAGPVDPENAAPDPDQPLPEKAFTEIQGVITNPAMLDAPLAGQEFGPAAIPPAPPMQAPGELVPAPVAKEGEGGTPTAGITSETGLFGYDLAGGDDEDEPKVITLHYVTVEDDREAKVTKEMAVFRNFRRKRRQAGQWHDFGFRAVDAVTAHNLNDGGRLTVRKAAGEIAVAGLAVLAADTGRVLMLQRALCDDDPAAGTWEFPGGHIEQGESALVGAWREWSEESGAIPPPGVQTGSWVSPSGVYQGIVWTVETEASVPVRCDTFVANPDDPDGDQPEAIAWWDPATLPGNPVVRPELQADIDAVMAALGCTDDDCCGADCCTGGCCDGSGGCGCGTLVDDSAPIVDEVAKAADADPKARTWPGWKLNGPAVAYWAPKVTAAVALPASRLNDLASGYLAANPAPSPDAPPQKRERNAAAAAWLTTQGVSFPLGGIASGIVTDGYLIGTVSATSLVTGEPAATGDWKPGAADAGRLAALGAAVPATAAGDAADDMTGAYLAEMGRSLADSQDAGLTAAAAGAALGAVVTDSTLAAGIVLERVVTASAAGAVICYGARGIDQVDILNGPNPCSVCAGLAASNPHAPGLVPVHPRCECAEAPHRQ